MKGSNTLSNRQMTRFFRTLLCILLLLLLPSTVYGLRLYSHAEYNAARERAVQTARSGNHKSALISLERLLKLEPDNHGAFNDYLTILIWDEQYQKALQKAQFLDLKETPEYVLRSLINAAEKERDSQLLELFLRTYINKYPVVPQDTPSVISGKSFEEVSELTEAIGMHQTSLYILKILHEKHPEDQDILASYIDALTREGQHEQVLTLLPLVQMEQAPEYGVDALIKSSKEAGATQIHQELVSTRTQPAAAPNPPPKNAIHIDPEVVIKTTRSKPSAHKLPIPPRSKPPEQIIATARNHLKNHDFEQAAKLLYPLYIQGKRSENLLNTVALYFTIQQEYARAAYIYQQLIEANPQNRLAKRYLILNLFYAGAPFKALEWLDTDPTLLNQAETDKILTDIKAFKLRWAGYTLPADTRQTQLLDALLAELRQELQEREPQGYDYNLSRLQMDYMVALRERGLTRQVIERYARLYAEDYTFPDYAMHSVADSYLDTKQPGEARDIYLDLLTRDPHNFSLKEGLFWAYFDGGEFSKGLELAEKLDNQAPLWRKDHTGKIVKINDEKLKTAILAAMAKGYANDLAGCQTDLEQLHAAAPYNAEILTNLAELYRWRGWPAQSLQASATAATFEPDRIATKISQASSLFTLGQFQEAEAIWTELLQQYPENSAVKKFDEEWTRLHGPKLLLWTDGGNSDSDQSNYGSSDFSLESILYDSLYKTGLRPYLHQYYTSATFDEGTGRYERVGLGTQYRRHRNTFSAEVSGSYRGDADIGLSLSSEHELSDQLQLSLGYDSFSTDIPVRAYFHNIDGPGYRAALRYRFHERTQLSAAYRFLDFSDGNRRNSMSFAANQRLWTSPRVTVDLHPSLYYSDNTKLGAPYFNPEQDISYTLSLTMDWLSYYHYEQKLTQKLALTGGGYYQKQYGSNPVYNVTYSHTWDMDRSLTFTYGIKWSSNYYDGDKENRIAAFGSLGWIF